MTLTYILVDFENVQPQASDFSVLRGDDIRVRIFHGAHQNKFDADVLKALLPLGDKADIVQSDRQGPNVLDFHISFYLGRLLQEHLSRHAASAQAARFFVISKDRGFDSLIAHIRKLGFDAHRVATIGAALGTGAAPIPPAARVAAVKKTAARKSPPAQKTAAVKSTKAATTRKLVESPKHIVLASLRQMGKALPGKRKGLERHIDNHLGRKGDLDAARALVDELERDGVLRIVDNKVEYTLPKAKQ